MIETSHSPEQVYFEAEYDEPVYSKRLQRRELMDDTYRTLQVNVYKSKEDLRGFRN